MFFHLMVAIKAKNAAKCSFQSINIVYMANAFVFRHAVLGMIYKPLLLNFCSFYDRYLLENMLHCCWASSCNQLHLILLEGFSLKPGGEHLQLGSCLLRFSQSWWKMRYENSYYLQDNAAQLIDIQAQQLEHFGCIPKSLAGLFRCKLKFQPLDSEKRPV